MRDYLFSTALPATAEKIQRKLKQLYTIRELLNDSNLTSLTPQTVYNWLQLLGYTYCPSKKSYYVDTHEKPKNIQY
jgi:DNA-binding transcriptional regulator YhcF (GntR family)